MLTSREGPDFLLAVVQSQSASHYLVGELDLPFVQVGLLLLDLRAQEGLVPLIEVQRLHRLAAYLRRDFPATPPPPAEKRQLKT